ncbi:unnamed protein product [Amaranthus hypochondriacus]
MASAQVMSNPAVSSRKKKDLEAGRKRLEEFRKKKAATKKAVSTSQSCIDVATSSDKQLSEDGHASALNSTNALTDNSFSAVTGAPVVSDHNDKFHVFSHSNGSDTIPCARFDTKNDDLSSSDLFKLPQGERSHEISGLKYQTDSNFSEQTDDGFGNFGNDSGEGRYANILSSSRPSASQDYSKGDSNSSLYGFGKDFLNTSVSINDVAAKAYTEGIVTTVSDPVPLSNFPASASKLHHSHLNLKNYSMFGSEEKKQHVLGDFGSQQTSERHDAAGLFDIQSHSAVAESNPRRSRPSFLDSLNIKDSSLPGRSFVDKDKFRDSEFFIGNSAVSSAIHIPSIASSSIDPLTTPASYKSNDVIFGNESKQHNSFGRDLENKLDVTSQKQNEDFAALEQHIEDLTQEKFSLQRTLEASKVLAESLAAENSSLTGSYNQQASIVNQLKDEMKRLQAEIKDRL